MPSQLALRHSVKPSMRFAASLIMLHMLSAFVICATAIPWPVKLAMLMLILMSLCYFLARDVLLLLRDSWCKFTFNQKEVSVVTRDGTSFHGQIANETFVSPYFVVLCVKMEGRRMPVSRVIFPDAMSTGSFRELCVYLKFA
jgi:toxin CptA